MGVSFFLSFFVCHQHQSTLVGFQTWPTYCTSIMHFFAIYCAENHVLCTLCGRLHRPKKTRSREQLVVSTHHRFARRNANSQLLSAQFSHCFMFFFPNVSPCCIISHMCSPCFHHCTTFPNVSGCFILGNGGENIGKWLFHQCFTYVHHFSMVLQN